MASRLLARLDAAIAASRDPVAIACLRAERAGLLARLGRIDEARRAIADVQARFALRPQAAVSAWLALAEGLCDHFGALAAAARDRLQRAHTLSAAGRMAHLHALAAAWLAHMEYGRNELVQMAQHLSEALRGAAADDHSARGRACQVAAFAYHWAGRLDRAQPWYDRARQHALADGDDAALSALMYNRAANVVGATRVACAFGELVGSDADAAWREAQLHVQSFAAFETGIGVESLAYMVPLLRAQVAAAGGDAAAALESYEAGLQHSGAGAQRLRPLVLADIAWCRLQLGDVARARVDFAAALAEPDTASDIDDRVLAAHRLAQVAAALGDEPLATTLRERARRDLAVLRAEQARLASLLDDTLAGA